MKDQVFLFLGAGGAATGIAQLLHRQMVLDGMSEGDAAARIWLSDASGLLVNTRDDVPDHKKMFLKDAPHLRDFHEMVKMVKPTAIIGASTCANSFTPEILRTMAELNERPVVFALSNPTSKAECTAEAAYKYTDGRVIFASGSPFDPVTYNGKIYRPGQGNNAYIFPGVALGVIGAGIHHINDDIFLLAARIVASLVKQEDLDQGRLYPCLSEIHEVSMQIAKAIAEEAYKNGTASDYPEPKDKLAFFRSIAYDYHYHSGIPEKYDWPGYQ